MKYYNRESKAEYVFNKYHQLMKESVLDVGADAMYLKPKVESEGVIYTGIGFGERIDMIVDLEKGQLPFKDRSFHTALCLDVLEHIESAHAIFGELCRVANKYVVISLPNPWAGFFSMLRRRNHQKGRSMKFYGFPVEPPEDRHRWFFGEKDALDFVNYNAQKSGFNVVDIAIRNSERPMGGNGIKGLLARLFLRVAFRSDILDLGLNHGTIWWVLERDS